MQMGVEGLQICNIAAIHHSEDRLVLSFIIVNCSVSRVTHYIAALGAE